MAIKVHLDPGHYGSNYNHSTTNSAYVESNFTWSLANYLKEELEKKGVEVTLSRYNKDDNPELYDRGYGSKGKDLFISLHSNACGTESVNRVVVIKPINCSDEVTKFAQGLGDLVKETMCITQATSVYDKINDNGKDWYGVIRGATAAGTKYNYILEHSFHTNSYATEWLLKDENIRKLAQVECEYICEYFVVKEENNVIEYVQYSHEDFIKNIAKYVNKIRGEFGIEVASPIIAQAINESAWGTSNKAKHNNYFGLKYREGRLDCNCGTFVDGSSEQNADGSYVAITDQWYEFKNMENGVRGYFQFINIDRYKNVKGVKDPFEYIKLLREDGYATSLSYIENITNLINKYNLTQYDSVSVVEDKKEETTTQEIYYRVRTSWDNAKSQIGAYKVLQNAINACKDGYYVFDNDGNVVYPEVKEEIQTTKELKNGDIITLRSGCTYYNGISIPSWVFNSTLYYRGKNENGVIFSILETGAITGVVKESDVNELNNTNTTNTTNTTTTTKKSNEDIAKEVIQGKWGNGQDRKDKLAAAGYNYSEVQAIVNKLLS